MHVLSLLGVGGGKSILQELWGNERDADSQSVSSIRDVTYLSHRILKYTGVEPKIGVGPPNHPFVHGFSMKFSPSILGYQYFWFNTHILQDFSYGPLSSLWPQRSFPRDMEM